MNLENGILEVVGAGTSDGLHSPAKYYQHLAQALAGGADPVAYLEHEIADALGSLEEALQGYDSFDTLAFMRFAASPLDFSHVQESQSQLEWSQAAQDVVALALLGLGLPRQPLTGFGHGQPDPSKAMGLAARILEAARALALIRGGRADHPLGSLAGEFLAYELTVRGRQYVSIASDLNTGLFGDPTVASAIKGLLGFTLDEIRAVRAASIALLNERFFGARDRLGESSQSADTDPEVFRRDFNIMMNECRLFGAVSARDAAERAGVEESTAHAVLEFFSFSRPASEAAHPLLRFSQGALPTPWGCIRDTGEYLLLNGFLGEDELRRDVERGLTAAVSAKQANAGKLWSKYDKRRAIFSEGKAAEALSKLLKGAEPKWAGQKFIGPVSPAETAHLSEDGDRTTTQTREYESDLLYVVDGVALCVEVKAGSITEKSRSGNPLRLATDLQKTLREGNAQADRLTKLIGTNHGVWGSNGKWIDLSDVQEVHSIVVMLDDMGPLSLSMNELALKGIIDTGEVPWIVSLHDLLAISQTVDHPAQFLEYLRRRRGRKLAKMVEGADELDMFMWFMTGGMYFDPDPHEMADQVPTKPSVKASDVRKFQQQARIRLGTLTDPLDAWFYAQEGLSAVQSPKPTRREEPWVEQYLTASESAQSPGWLRFGADLVGLSGKAQRDLGKGLREQCRKARSGDVERSLTSHSATPYGAWLLTAVALPEGVAAGHLHDYIDSKQYQTNSNRSMLLLYSADGFLTGSRYRGGPQPKTLERDAAITVAPLKSLAATFTKLPPSARRSTKKLNGGRGKKKQPRRR
ncbi:hypothetical protein [Arthrobacter sp. TS-15]|uniref:hypothetical protein n=1 Tax=Arthrobacter sp. TS-15 TaxID=2510797 RepID=UPI001930E4B8|nr:hypothetical protein [Arthrobacter sp. TS-15]